MSELAAVFNIGSSKVGGALFLPQKSGVPKIILSVLEPITITEKPDAERLLAAALKAIGTVAGKLHLSGLGAPKRIFCTLSSPWYVSQTRTITLKKNTPFIFTEKLADELIQKEIKMFSEEHQVLYGKGSNAMRTIELKNIKTTLNGYETASPLWKKAEELQMIIFISAAPETVLKKIEGGLSKHFHFKEIKFSSFAAAAFTVARDLSPQENFLLMDVSGEVTEIFMVKKNVLRESISFPIGCNFLLRGTAEGLGTTLGEARSLISLWKDGHAEEAVGKKIKSVLGDLFTRWLQSFQESLANLSQDISIPGAIYLVTERNYAQLFRETIKTEQFSQYTLAESKFEITLLDPELLHGLATFEESVLRDPTLITDCVYINRFLVKI